MKIKQWEDQTEEQKTAFRQISCFEIKEDDE